MIAPAWGYISPQFDDPFAPIGFTARTGINFPREYSGRWEGNITNLVETGVDLGGQIEVTVRDGYPYPYPNLNPNPALSLTLTLKLKKMGALSEMIFSTLEHRCIGKVVGQFSTQKSARRPT
jgi:hypothetical protein